MSRSLKSLNRSLKSEFIGRHPPGASEGLDEFPRRAEDRRRALTLPIGDIERAVGVGDPAKPLHHEVGRVVEGQARIGDAILHGKGSRPRVGWANGSRFHDSKPIKPARRRAGKVK